MELLKCFLLFSATIATLLVYALTAATKSMRQQRRQPLPPGPAPLPIVGNIFSLVGEAHRTLADLSKVHGPIMTLKLGQTTAIVVSSADGAREALQAKDQQLSGRAVPDVANALGHADMSIAFQATTGQMWKQLKSISTINLLSNKRLDSSRRVREDKVRELVAYFRRQAGRPVDFGHAVYGAFLNILSSIVFSVDMVDLNSESTQEFRDLVTTINEALGKPNVSDFFPVLRLLDLQGRRRAFRTVEREYLRYINELIDRRMSSKAFRAGSETTDDYLDHLLQLHAEAKLNREIITSLLAELFSAGTDTTTISLVWAMAELQRNPSMLAKARAELQDVIGSSGRDEVEETDIAKLPYLQAVVKETLRLHPPVPFLPHRATEEVELGGYAVPKGAQLLVNVWAIGRDERSWPEAEVFKPERFLEREMDYKGRDFELIPFGSGRRACPGMPMALRTVHLMLATLLHGFEWRLPDGMQPGDVDMTEKIGLTLNKAVPLRVVPFPVCREDS